MHAKDRKDIEALRNCRLNMAKIVDDQRIVVENLDPNAIVKAKGDVDLVRDIQWVYDNLKDLIIESMGPGSPCALNEAVLAKAPSSGAIAMAKYARDDDKAFFSRFVVKLLPRDLQPKEEISDRERLLNVDPEFETLEKYFG
jgi:hypothetical protein